MKKFLTEYPELIKEWHPTKNGDSRPEEFTHGSTEKVWWVCPKGHDYDARIYTRTKPSPSGCPFCSGNKVGDHNNLLFLFPDISSEWHPTKNGDSRPEEFTGSNGKKVWWICSKGHDYSAVINSRTGKNKTGCPYCSGRKASEENNLKHSFPDIASEWNVTKNGDLSPENFTYGSIKKVWWVCSKGHEYNSSINSRTNKAHSVGCPYCSGNKVSEENNLKHLFPDIASEWHSGKNENLKPEEFTFGSKRKVWWVCPKGHEYDATIGNRTIRNSGCPFCSHQSSAPEFRILTELRYIFHDVKTRYKIEGVEIDVYIPKLNLAIEYDGSYFHQGKEQKDLEKNNFLESRNIKVIRVRHKPLKRITGNDLIVKNDDLSKSDLNNVFKKIFTFCENKFQQRIRKYIDFDNFLNDNLFREYLSYFPSPLPEISLAKKFPHLISEWDFDKNEPLTPDNFTSGSNQKVWWICPNGHSYDATIGKKTKKKPDGCPYCSGRRVGKDNNLLFLFPKISSEWHPTKNGDSRPEEFTYGSKKKVWWLCHKGHDYGAIIKNRTSKKPTGCPHCYRNVS